MYISIYRIIIDRRADSRSASTRNGSERPCAEQDDQSIFMDRRAACVRTRNTADTGPAASGGRSHSGSGDAIDPAPPSPRGGGPADPDPSWSRPAIRPPPRWGGPAGGAPVAGVVGPP